MSDTRKAQEQLETIDGQILKLLNRRARTARRLSALSRKGESGFPSAKERRILQKLLRAQPGPLPDEGLEKVFREIYSVCAALDRPVEVYFLGPEATHSHAASVAAFGRSAKHIPVPGFVNIFREVEKSPGAYGVVPLENSSEGVVGLTIDLLLESPLSIRGELYLPIRNHLLANIPREEIRRIYSHPQPIAQCRGWIMRNFPSAEIRETASTTRGVELALQDKHGAAIASELAAELYSIGILEKDIQDRGGNTTRFLVVGHHGGQPTGNDKTSAIFLVKNRVGALYEALLPFRKYGINLTKIESRPTKREAWEYAFYIDFEGHRKDKKIQQALAELEKPAAYVKVLGSYPRKS